MNKKLIGILIIAIFLITSVGVISAADDSISVKMKWDDDSNAPSAVTVNLVKDGKVVDTMKLSSKNSWSATFKVDDDGDYDIKLSKISGYSSVITGNADKGFVVTNSLIKSNVLGSDDTQEADNSSDDSVLGSSLDNDSLGSSAGPVLTDGPNLSDGSNLSDGNSSGNGTNSTPNTNSTGNNNSTDDDNSTDDSDDSESVTTTTTTTTTTKIITKDNKNPTNNTTTTIHKNTGFPLAVLVVALFIVAFVPFARKK